MRVLEYFSPPPSRGTASDFSRQQPPLDEVRYHDARWAKQWPSARGLRDSMTSFVSVSSRNALLSFRDTSPSHLIATLVDTEFLRVIHGTVRSGHVEEFAVADAESVLYVTEGELWVDVWSDGIEYKATSVLGPGDAMFLPAGCSERLLVRDSRPAAYLRGFGEVPEGWMP